MAKFFINPKYCLLLFLLLLSSCITKIERLRTVNALANIKKGMHIRTVDSIGSLNRFDQYVDKNTSKELLFDTQKRTEFKVKFENIEYKVVVIKILTEIGQKDSLVSTSEYSTNMADAPNKKVSVTSNKKVDFQIESYMFLIFKDDKIEKWVFLYELLNSPIEEERKLGNAIASSFETYYKEKYREE